MILGPESQVDCTLREVTLSVLLIQVIAADGGELQRQASANSELRHTAEQAESIEYQLQELHEAV